MDLQIIKADNKLYAKAHGRITTANSMVFEQLMQPLMVGENPNIELDCEKLEYVSSSGLRLFLSLQKSVNARRGYMVITNLSDDLKGVFKMTGFSKIFKIQ